MNQNIITLKNKNLSVSISSLGAEFKSIQTADGTEHLHQPDNFWQDHAPILFPICGTPVDGKIRVDGREYAMDSHGFIKASSFEVLKKTEDSATFVLASSPETKKFYPFDFELQITYQLHESSISIRHKVLNQSDKIMYFSIGYHEGYQCIDGLKNYEIHFEKQEPEAPFVFETRKSPDAFLENCDGHSVLNLCDELFQNDITVVYEHPKSEFVCLKNRQTGSEITVSFPGFDNLLIWSCSGANYVCIEPWCGMAEYESFADISLKPGIHTLKPNCHFEGEHSIIF